MAYTSGTAANYKDLLAILATFAAANGWEILHQTAEQIYLKGEGAAGTDEIYAGVQAYEVPASGRYNYELFGSWSYVAGRAYNVMPMTSGGGVHVYLWNQPIPYWMVATPRRIMVFVKISTVYQCFHLGLIEPPATDNQYPYPLFIGGCGSSDTNNYSATGNNNNTAFWSGATSGARNGRMHVPGGGWYTLQSSSYGAVLVRSSVSDLRTSMVTAIDGSYLLSPFFVLDADNKSILGAIDGLFHVSGYNNTSENIITVEGVNYMVFQDVYRTGTGDYCCMRLA